MQEAEAIARAEKVVARAKSESMTVAQARAYAAELGLVITPGLMDPDTLSVYRFFIYPDDNGTQQKLSTRITGLRASGEDSIAESEDARILREMVKRETVNHPAHYNMGGEKEADGTAKFEVIKVIENWDLGFCFGNALKYILRAPHKGSELEDLKKARWYLRRTEVNGESASLRESNLMLPEDVASAWALTDLLETTIYWIRLGDGKKAILSLDAYIVYRFGLDALGT